MILDESLFEEVEQKEITGNIKRWYLETFKDDAEGNTILDDCTFKGLHSVLNNGFDVYTYLFGEEGLGDSTIRTRVFKELAARKNVPYSDVYDLWLNGDQEEAEIDSLYHDVSQEELIKMGAFDNMDESIGKSVKEKRTYDGNLKEGDKYYTITIFPEEGKSGFGLPLKDAEDVFEEVYFSTVEEAKNFADKKYPKADLIVIRENIWNEKRRDAWSSGGVLNRVRGKWVKDKNIKESYDDEKVYSVYFGTGAAWLKEFIVRAFNPEEAADKAADLAVEKGFTNLYNDFEALDELADEGQTGEEYAEANNLVPLGNNSYYFDLQRIEELDEDSLKSLDEAKDSKVPTDLSRFKGTITKLLKDNYNEIKNLETKEEIKNKIKELLAKEKIDTTASKRLVNNLEKSKNAINSMYIVTNSILAGEDAAVLGEGLITEYKHKIKVPKYNKVYDELERLGYRVSASTEENSIQVSKKYEKNLKKATDYLDSLGIEHKTKYSPVQGRYYMTITFTPEMLDNPNDVVEESLKEDLENTPSAPEAGPNMGLASVINNAIIDELKTIDTYNDAIVSATELGNADLVAIFTEINNDEHKHVGNLQKALSLVSPQAESIPEGEKEAEEIISKVEDREETANDILNNIEEPVID